MIKLTFNKSIEMIPAITDWLKEVEDKINEEIMKPMTATEVEMQTKEFWKRETPRLKIIEERIAKEILNPVLIRMYNMIWEFWGEEKVKIYELKMIKTM